MLTAAEKAFLKNPDKYSSNKNYSRVLRHRVQRKVLALQEEFKILNQAQFMSSTANCNAITVFSNGEKTLN